MNLQPESTRFDFLDPLQAKLKRVYMYIYIALP
jgi:hypothetical protein